MVSSLLTFKTWIKVHLSCTTYLIKGLTLVVAVSCIILSIVVVISETPSCHDMAADAKMAINLTAYLPTPWFLTFLYLAANFTTFPQNSPEIAQYALCLRDPLRL